MPEHEAFTYTFDDGFRPVPLERVVTGYSVSKWTANKTYDQDLYRVVKQHSDRKPVLIFCGTRNACQGSADALKTAYTQDRIKPWFIREYVPEGVR